MHLPRKLSERGFSTLYIFLVLLVITFGCIEAFKFNASPTASVTYDGACTTATYSAPSSKAQPCVEQAQDLMDGIQHQNYNHYRTATNLIANSTFGYKDEYYLIMNGLYNDATANAVKTLTDNSQGQLTSGANGSWQILCRAAVAAGLTTGDAGTNTLNFYNSNHQEVAGQYTTDSSADIFAKTCGAASDTTGTTSTTTAPTTNASIATTTASIPALSSGFVTTSGTNLMLGGKPIKFIGFNPTGMIGQCWSGNNWSTADMDAYFKSLPPDGISRIFAVQNNTGGANYVETIVQEATKYHQHLIIGLSDDNSNCSDLDGSGNGQQNSGKTLAYYESAYKSGSNYANWVKQVVTPLANNPTVAIWEIGNEPFHSGNGEGGATIVGQGVPLSVAQAYVDGSAALIKAAGAKQLISIAPADIGDMGGVSDDEQLFKNLNVIDDHDYSWQNGEGEVSGDFSSLQKMSTDLGKPFIIDEAGVPAGSGCTSSTPSWTSNAGLSASARESFLMTKANDYFKGGASALVFWNYLLATESDNSCDYAMFPSDPMIGAVSGFAIP